MDDSVSSERVPKLKEGLDILEHIKSRVVSLDMRLATISTNLIGEITRATEKTDYSENKMDAEDNTSDGLGRIVGKGKTTLKILESIEDTLDKIEKEV